MSSQIQHKLMHYEVQPPPKVWTEIEAALDEAIPVALGEKLFAYEAQPEAGNWEKISTSLDQALKTPVKNLSFFTRYRRPLKYAGATAAMVVIATITSLLISKKS